MTTLFGLRWLTAVGGTALAALLGGLTLASQSAQTAAPPATASIVGQVIEAESQKPVRGVVVTASDTSSSQRVSPVLTDEQGRFAFLGLSKGRFVLSADKGGYVLSYFGQERVDTTRSTLITIADGQHVSGLTIKTWKYAAITGTVLDEAGEPVVNVRVEARPRTYVGGRPAVLAPTHISRTDDRGVYRLSHVMPGEFIVGVVPYQIAVGDAASFTDSTPNGRRGTLLSEFFVNGDPDSTFPAGGRANGQTFDSSVVWLGPLTPPPSGAGQGTAYAAAFHAGVADPSSARVVPVRAGSTTANINIRLLPSPAHRVSGRVTGGEASLGMIAVRLMLASIDDPAQAVPLAVAFTDSAGAFSFPTVPRGSYRIEVLDIFDESPGFAVATITLEPDIRRPVIRVDAWSDRSTLWAVMPVSVGDNDIQDLSVPLQRGTRIQGRIEFDTQTTAPPPRRVIVDVERADNRAVASSFFSVVSAVNAANEFRTIELPAGRYFVTASVLLPGNWAFTGAFVNGRDASLEPIDLGGSNVEGVVVRVSDHANEIKGTVRDQQEQPDPTASVLLFPADERMWLDFGLYPRRLVDARAGSDGTYAIRGAPSGDYFIVAVPDAGIANWRNPAFLQTLSRLGSRIQIGDTDRTIRDLRVVTIR